MSFELKKKEGVEEGVQRVIREGVTKAARGLQDSRAPAAAIHTARKRLKEARAILRLVRDEVGESVYDRENRTFRDAARPLSDVRDADAVSEAFDRLLRKHRNGLRRRSIAGLREALSAWRGRVRTRVLQREAALDTAVQRLERAKARLEGLTIDSSEWRAIRKGLHRTYRLGRDAMAEATRDVSDDTLHEWRKRAKDLRYQLQFLCKARPGVMDAAVAEAHDLGDILGDDHDLALLRQLLDGGLRRSVEPADRQTLERTIARRRDALQAGAAELGDRVYAESPRRFVERVREYWKAWR